MKRRQFLAQPRPAHDYEGDEPTLFEALPDGQVGVSTGGDSTLKLWKLDPALSLIKTIRLPIDPVALIAHPDGHHLLLGGTAGEVSLWDLKPNPHVIHTTVKHKDWVSIGLNSKGSLVATTGLHDPFLRLLNPMSLDETQEPRALPRGGGSGVAILPDGNAIAVSNTFETISVYEGYKTGAPQIQLQGVNVPFAVSPDNVHMAANLQTINKVAILNRARLRSIARQVPVDSDSKLVSAHLAPDGEVLSILQENGTVSTIGLTTGKRSTISLPHDKPFGVQSAFSSDGALLGAPSDTKACLYQTNQNNPVRCAELGFVARILAFNANRALLAAGGPNGQLAILDTTTNQIRASFVLNRGETLDLEDGKDQGSLSVSIYSIVFQANDQTVAVGGSDGEIDLFDLRGRELRLARRITGHTNAIFGMCFDARGTKLASASSDGTIRLWDAKTGSQKGLSVRTIAGVQYVSCTSDFAMMAATGGRAVGLFDTARQIRIGEELQGVNDFINSLSMSSDGQVVSALTEHPVLVWNLKSKDLAGRACEIVNRNMTKREWQQFVNDIVPCQVVCPKIATSEACR